MKVQVRSASTGATAGAVGALVVLLGIAAAVLVMGLLLWWLVPVATAGALVLGFWQSIAVSALLSVLVAFTKS